ncbi:nucleotidyltransferase domain-containing protein [Cyanobium sp. ATX-6F1]|uniref:nucleotidyltransferase domain-containing protein n=1 Tax=Cyanobium sp. ATX-6F1 TaxID=3137388 RepID=UPI0039BE5DBB
MAFPMGPPPTISVACKATTPFAMPVRSLTQSVLRWPEPEEILRQVEGWAAEQAASIPSLQRVAVFGSYGRGSAGVGSDLDLLLIDAAASGPQHERLRGWPLEQLPLSCDALVLTPASMPTCWQRDPGLPLSCNATPAGCGRRRSPPRRSDSALQIGQQSMPAEGVDASPSELDHEVVRATWLCRLRTPSSPPPATAAPSCAARPPRSAAMAPMLSI